MDVIVIFRQPEDPFMLGRLAMPDYDTAACYVMQHLPPSAQARAIIEDRAGNRTAQPYIRVHYELLVARQSGIGSGTLHHLDHALQDLGRDAQQFHRIRPSS